jgi:hypothetical protein
MIVLPRNAKQAAQIRQLWPDLVSQGRIHMPEHAIDGLNLIWHSDFVISGGGTMNREAAALGIPVYSIFRGTLGAVDRYLAEQGRLVLIEKVEDVQTKIKLTPRNGAVRTGTGAHDALQTIVKFIVGAAESRDQITN